MHNDPKSAIPQSPKILLLSAMGAGSIVGEAVLRLVSEHIASKGGGTTMVALKAFRLPLFDGEGDLGAFPQEAKELAETIGHHHALMLIAPEYHQGIAPLVKNSLDWSGRAHTLAEYRTPLLHGKSLGIVTLSPEQHLGVQALTQMASLCHALGGRILPGSMGVLDQWKSLGDDRQIKDPGLVKRLSALAEDLLHMGRRSLGR